MTTYTPLNLYTNFKNAATKHPHQLMAFDELLPAFEDLQLETTYQKAHELVLTRAFQLAHLGIQKNDKVIIYKSPQFDTYLLAVAVSYLGAVPVMVSYHLPTTALTVFCERLNNPYIIYDVTTADKVQAIANSTIDRQILLSDLIKQPHHVVSQETLALDDICYMTHTSGTTGTPKLICHSQKSMGYRTLWQRSVLDKMTKPGNIAFHISPVHSRFNIGISSLMALGLPFVAMSAFDLKVITKTLLHYQPIALETHPNNFVQWRSLLFKTPEIFANVCYYHSTFDAINLGTMAQFLETSKHTNALFLQVYGQSECGPMILKSHTLTSIPTDHSRDMGVGLSELTKARICDENGQLLAPGEKGHIQLYSLGRALTYYQEDERFNQNVAGPWWDSGDFGYQDAQGHLFLLDRQVDQVQTITSTLAIEDQLLDQLNFLAEVVIVRDAKAKAQPVIALQADTAFDATAWFRAVNEFPYLNTPIIKAFDEIPRTATMKVQRLKIEQLLIANQF